MMQQLARSLPMRQRPVGQSSSTPRSHPRRGLVEGREERSPRQDADGRRGVLQLVREEEG